MKNACKIEKCELCVKQTKAPGNMEFVSTKACCKLLLASKGEVDSGAQGTVAEEDFCTRLTETKGVNCFGCNCFQVLKLSSLLQSPPPAFVMQLGKLLIIESA